MSFQADASFVLQSDSRLQGLTVSRDLVTSTFAKMPVGPIRTSLSIQEGDPTAGD
jgi:hypothetical protein